MRLPVRILAQGAIGLALAAGAGVAVSHLAGQQIGPVGEPLRDVRGLAPPQRVTTTTRGPATRPARHVTRIPPPSFAAPAPAPNAGPEADHQRGQERQAPEADD
jgi:hypothetical protein